MQLFYHPDINENSESLVFDKTESRHIVRVLRKNVGDILQITNGKGLLITSEIISANDKQCITSTISTEQKEKSRSYNLHIAIAPTKNNDRYEWFLEKATEIGIDEITPLLCDHSERKVIKPERFEKIIEAAMKQSLKFHLPKLHPLTSFETFISQPFQADRFIAHCAPGEKHMLKNVLKPKRDLVILIGPEGDFSSQEIGKAMQHDFKPVSLGDSRLRTETAGIVACHTAAIINP